MSGPPAAVRRKLPDERQSLTHKFSVAGHEGYIHVGLYETGEPGEIFVRMAKEGSTISGLMDSFATAISLALQHGVPGAPAVRQVLAHALRAVGLHREPGHPARELDHGLPVPLAGVEVREAGRAGGRGRAAAPAADEIQRVAEVVAAAQTIEVVDGDRRATPRNGHATATATRTATPAHTGNGNYSFIARTDAPTCPECGSIMIPNGSCHKCVNCGTTSGCS